MKSNKMESFDWFDFIECLLTAFMIAYKPTLDRLLLKQMYKDLGIRTLW